jgi:hypothetical protein
MSDIADAAQELLMENIAAIPVKKSKAPDLPKGSVYFQKRIPEDKVKEVFNGAYGIGIKAGILSEGIECIDFDDHDKKYNIKKIFNQFLRTEFIQHLWQSGKAYVQQTPSGGFHFIYRYKTEKYEGSKPLARWEDGNVMIETRGDGGYFVTAPTPKYKPLYHTLQEIETIEAWERNIVIKTALEFNQQKGQENSSKDIRTEPTDPISYFNAEKVAYAKNILEENGWQKIDEHDGIERWVRPGKDIQYGPSATWGHKSNQFYVFSTSQKIFKTNVYYNPFQIFLKYKHEGNYKAALQDIEDKYGFKKNEKEPEYIRVGDDYYKIIRLKDRYGIERKELKRRKTETIRLDHGKEFLKQIPKYDSFTIEPDNFNYRPVVDGCYNLYREFPFKPKEGSWYWTDVLLHHIFGEQYKQGLKYLQILYLYPKQILPILALVSAIRGTGKTTFLNWMSMLFGDNMTIIGSQEIQSEFNSGYVSKNIICIEETTINKKITTEKLKYLSTGKHINVNPKHVDPYKLPLYAKIILTSNDEDRFAQIDQEEIRYFVRKLGIPSISNVNIEDDLVREIPAFLYYLSQMPKPDFSQSRMVFTYEELENKSLEKVKKESRPTLYKEIREYICEEFANCSKAELYATPKDIKETYFYNNSKIEISYIRRVLKEEFNMKPEDNMRYYILNDIKDKTGTPFRFDRKDFISDDSELESGKDQWEDDNEPF